MPTKGKIIIPIIILLSFVLALYLSHYLVFSYGKKCTCYGYEMNAKCYGIKTTCTGLVPPLPLTVPSSDQSCEFQKTGGTIRIDFSKCKRCTGSTYVGFGSTHYEFFGLQENYCQFRYGGEIEDPNWNGELNTHCSVPAELGEIEFIVSNYGVDFSPASAYCVKN